MEYMSYSSEPGAVSSEEDREAQALARYREQEAEWERKHLPRSSALPYILWTILSGVTLIFVSGYSAFILIAPHIR